MKRLFRSAVGLVLALSLALASFTATAGVHPALFRSPVSDSGVMDSGKKDSGITGIKESGPVPEGHIIIDVEKFTLGQGYLVEPAVVPFYNGDNGAAILTRLLGEGNYRHTGEIESGFYLSKIKDGPHPLHIPKYITDNGGPSNTENEGKGDPDWLGEFDYGFMSGWMYFVNNRCMPYGCSDYQPQDGDVIRWQFTLHGYGSDLGTAFMGEPMVKVANKDRLTAQLAKINSSKYKDKIIQSGRAIYDAALKTAENMEASQMDTDAAAEALSGLYADYFSKKEVSSFQSLAPSIRVQKVRFGTALHALKLPPSLAATVNGKSAIVDGVSWNSTPDYSPTAAGTYSFRAELPEKYVLKGTSAPVITVSVDEHPLGNGGTPKALKVSAEDMSQDVSKVLLKTVPSASFGTFAGEWTVLALARSGAQVPKNYYNTYYQNVVNYVKKKEGNLSSSKYTEYSRAIIGLTAIGRDPRNVGSYNLIRPLADFDKVKYQGINGPIFALIALDTANYDMPEAEKGKAQNSREKMVEYILSKEIPGGGWALSGSTPDPDITAMALQALSKYKQQSDVAEAIERGLNTLSRLQRNDGGYQSWGTLNAESTAQVIVALTELGIDPKSDSRFIKSDGSWLLSALSRFYIPEKGFSHILNAKADAMATDQCAYALAAYNRLGGHSLYDMTDVIPYEIEISSFAELHPAVKNQTAAYGTALEKLKLPTSLTATINGKKGTIAGITWTSSPQYDPNTAGTYLFTAKLPQGNYTLSGNAELPQITVMLAEKGSSGNTVKSPGSSTAPKEIILQPDEAPAIAGEKATITTTVQADIAAILASATAEKPEGIKIALPAASILEQLKNDGIKAAALTVLAPEAVANNTNPNAKLEITLSQAVLQAAKNGQKDLTVSVVNSETGREAYTWIFSGAGLKNSIAPVNDVNLSLHTVPAANDAAVRPIVEANTQDKKASGVLLKFSGSGLLPGTASVKVYVGDQEGCAANAKVFLYSLNPTEKSLEQMRKSEYSVDTFGYITFSTAQYSDYVLLPNAATNPYPVISDTVFPTGIQSGKTYTFGIIVTVGAAPAFTIGNANAFRSSVKRKGDKYYLSVTAIGAPGTMTAVYSTLPGQKPNRLCYIAVKNNENFAPAPAL
ncbi:DUF4430 domain-containing protein [Caproiciproducens galactitolivorans]|uniref:DUF4430 domain-containing protein n=1 Tax=Caproiciproducens galactitolivorans TaxID=642589 RepID=UPI00240935F5|nr:DUF4430 domain-containing protein [Caproiciproducens galactitolivorans]